MMERGIKPSMTEPQLLEAWGIKEEEVKPLAITPKRDARKVSPNLDNHIKISSEQKAKRKKKPLVAKHQEPKKEKPKKEKAQTRKKHDEKWNEMRRAKRKEEIELGIRKERANLKDMTDEERKDHKAKLTREYRARIKASGVKKELTPEQRKHRQELNRASYNRKKNDPEFKARKAQSSKKHRQANLEKYREIGREWHRKKKLDGATAPKQ